MFVQKKLQHEVIYGDKMDVGGNGRNEETGFEGLVEFQAKSILKFFHINVVVTFDESYRDVTAKCVRFIKLFFRNHQPQIARNSSRLSNDFII